MAPERRWKSPSVLHSNTEDERHATSSCHRPQAIILGERENFYSLQQVLCESDKNSTWAVRTDFKRPQGQQGRQIVTSEKTKFLNHFKIYNRMESIYYPD